MKLYLALVGLLTAFVTLAKYGIIACIIIALCLDPYGMAHFVGSFVAAIIKPILGVF